jgi:DNA-binding SARP family transcriptional activator
MFEFCILGPVQAVRDGRELELGGPKRHVLLALLLVAAGRVIPSERLAEELWGGRPPPGAAGTLRSHVSRLRTVLQPDAVLLARGGGYALAAEAGLLDAARFERLARGSSLARNSRSSSGRCCGRRSGRAAAGAA